VTYTYTADFHGTYSDGTNFTLEQYVTESQYQAYTAVQGGNPIPMILYKTSSEGEYFLSRNVHRTAVKEYRTSNPTLKLKSTTIKIAAWFFLFGASVFAGIGGHEIRLSKKYPRSDILSASEKFAAEQERDELLKEFDAAYEKYMAREKIGLPPADENSAPRLPDKNSDKTNA
jgi:hypothetical protein